MTLADWAAESRARFRNLGVRRGVAASANELWVGALRRAGHRWNYGERIYDREWDAMLVLDACRVDLLREVARDGAFPFLPERIGTFTSAASMSAEWMTKNFGPEFADETARTAYVSGNPFTRDLDPADFARLDDVWRYGWDDEFGGVKPRPVTDRAVAAGRETDADRLLVHYLQPHVPFRSLQEAAIDWGDPEENFGRKNGAEGAERGPWQRYRDGDLPFDRLWAAYRDNLEWVLDDVGLLLENLDADTVVVTADHANAMGEWWCYGHPDYAPVPALKRVPWVELSATDEGTYEPTLEPPEVDADGADDPDDRGVEDRLAALGYR
ncbi:metal-dependent hydrolase [Candidatus Halobonum tyrrellensis]|uniref:Putative membrane-associated, metal-dependent hydrolase n=1 Tax=Candidatus Halobonum tyrrellensis G22 TaxID=1324957 RepID=V4GV57_9EURY|nr:metal-dependent hydrolase [Candidatus Halobonum tyrrellensis]ESP89031.1 putative membrane-associated, metal-dependent hydrolase [Candidatus Halobonum tyrrellensis G22]